MPHIQDAASRLAHDRERFFKNLVEDFIGRLPSLVSELFQAIRISIRLILDSAETVLDFLAKFLGLGAQLFIREFLNLGFKSIDGQHTRHQALDFALILGPKYLT